MLALFRRFANTWAARLFFMVLVAAFALWGVADMIRNAGNDDSVATVGDRKITVPEMQEAIRRQLAQWQRAAGGKEPTTEMRRAAVEQSLQRLVAQAAIEQEVTRLHLAVPDDALRQEVFSLPAFQGTNGQFDRARFQQVLQANGLTEGRFLSLMRSDLGQREVMEAVKAGTTAPDALVREVFDLQQEKRVATLVDLPFAGAPQPPAPTDAQLQRQYDNNPDSYSTAEYRRIHAVVLSAETIARSVEVPDDQLRAYYDSHKSEFEQPEKRTVEVIQTQDEAAAKRLADQWRLGAGWDQMQQAATAAGGNPVELTTATESEIPSPELARAAFATPPEVVPDPIQGALGWYVMKVTAVQPGTDQSFDAAKDGIRGRIAQERAGDLVYDRANKVEDTLASGAKLEDLPGDLGLAAVAGTLDAQGNTPQGTPAPIPAGPELRSALVSAAFAAKQGDAPHLTEVQQADGGVAYYAVEVDGITPPARKPFDEVRDQVREDWLREARRHEQDEAAAKLMTAARSGQALEDAAKAAGLQPRRSPPIGRQAPTPGVAPELVQPIFGLKQGEATMIESPEGFTVAQLVAIQVPEPSTDPVGYGRTRDQIAGVLSADVEQVFAQALRNRLQPRVNTKLMETLAEP